MLVAIRGDWAARSTTSPATAASCCWPSSSVSLVSCAAKASAGMPISGTHTSAAYLARLAEIRSLCQGSSSPCGSTEEARRTTCANSARTSGGSTRSAGWPSAPSGEATVCGASAIRSARAWKPGPARVARVASCAVAYSRPSIRSSRVCARRTPGSSVP